ncbi:hypothetical protein [Ferrovum sp.]|nr:hypothetical protein [Ferrovum sp.]
MGQNQALGRAWMSGVGAGSSLEVFLKSPVLTGRARHHRVECGT